MKNIYTALIALTLLLITTSARSEDSPDNKDCGNSGGNMLEINACASEQFKHADDELNRLYKEKMAALETKESKNRLRDSQRAWVSFRDKACSYESDQFSSGSIWPLIHFSCMGRHTQKRIDDLKDYLECTGMDCPN